MKKAPEIRPECVETLLDKKFIRVFDLQYAPGRHYYDATRREKENLAALKTDAEFRTMLPDAVTCFVVLHIKDDEPRLLLSYEYRYPAGRFLLSPPAGLIDDADRREKNPLFSAAIREIREETGISFGPGDKIQTVAPLLFSSPGMTDESNALVAAEIWLPDGSSLNQSGAEETECFSGFCPVTKREAKELLKESRDEKGFPYSVYTWMALSWFIAAT